MIVFDIQRAALAEKKWIYKILIFWKFQKCFKLELNPRGQVAPQVYVDNCDATN